MTRGIIIAADHSVQKGTVSPLHISIDGQNGVDTLEFIVPEGMADWAWRVEIEQNGKKTWRMMEDGHVWTVRAGEVVEGYGKIQAVASLQSGETTLCWKTREFDICVFPAINASEAVTPGEASALDEIAAQVKSDADRADAAATRAEDAAAGAENIVNTAISDIEAEGQKQAAAVASSGTQALEAIGQVEQTAIAQVQAAGTAQVGAVEDAGDGKLAQIDAANAHAPQINEGTGKWQVWDAQTGAYVDTDTDAQGPQGKTGATGPQGPAGADGVGLPVATAEDAGKVPVVGADGSYTLGDPVPEVDTTLTEAGTPADAAAVGEAIEAISPDDAAVDGKPWTSKHIVDMLCPPLEASGNPVTCTPVAGYPLEVKAAWQPRQAGTGDPYPPGGGANLLDMAMCTPVDPAYMFGLPCEIDGDVVTISGVPNIETEGPYSFGIISNSQTELRGHGYVITPFAIEGAIHSAWGLRTADEANIAISATLYPGVENTIKLRLTCSQNALTEYAPYSNIRPITGLDEVTVTLSDGVGTGTTATLDLPSTVYGGEVGVETGEGVETVHGVVLDGTEDWTQSSGGNFGLAFFEYRISNTGALLPSSAGSIANAKKSQAISHFKIGNPYSENVDNAGWIYNTENSAVAVVRIRASQFENTDDWKAYLAAQAAAGTPVTIAYKLATPQPIQATGTQSLLALPGTNTIYTDADSVTVTGRADPNHAIQTLSDRIAALESETIEGGTNA